MMGRTPLVLLPGLLCDAALWQAQIDDLSDIAEITVADLGRDDQLGAMARGVLAVAPERFALAGLSMGGYVAMEIVRQAPDRVTRLALLATSARADSVDEKAKRQALIDLARRGRFKGVTRRLLPQLIHPMRLTDRSLTDAVFAMAERIGQMAFERQQRVAMNRPDSRRDLGLVHCPTMVLCGRQDARTPLALSSEIAEKVRRSSLVVVEDCGHLAPLERPRAVSDALRDWLGT
ncbi:MAG: alpha/beta fold hydrolase [Rhodospirillales bacterium]